METTFNPAMAAPCSAPTLVTAPARPVSTDGWRTGAPVVGVPTFMRTKSAFTPALAYHNSIRSTVAVATVLARQAGTGAAKQAAPPRGVPR